MKDSNIKLKNELDREQAVACLTDIVNGLKEGRVCVEKAEQSLCFSVPASLKVRIKARQREHKESISLKMSWPRHAETEEAAPDSKVSAGTTE